MSVVGCGLLISPISSFSTLKVIFLVSEYSRSSSLAISKPLNNELTVYDPATQNTTIEHHQFRSRGKQLTRLSWYPNGLILVNLLRAEFYFQMVLFWWTSFALDFTPWYFQLMCEKLLTRASILFLVLYLCRSSYFLVSRMFKRPFISKFAISDHDKCEICQDDSEKMFNIRWLPVIAVIAGIFSSINSLTLNTG